MRARTIAWTRSQDAEYPYLAQVGGHQLRIRINDFPVDEHKYTLLVDGQETESFDDWPEAWTKPPLPRP